MTRGALSRRLRARLSDDERGFSLLEVIIAITVIFGALTALAYTASIGLSYVGFARERQAATGLANQLMERTRGLAYERIQQGLLTTDVQVDPNVVTGCTGDPAGTYRFESCGGETVVHSSGLTPAEPLVPNSGSFTTGYPTPYTYRVYVTNDDPTASPYRLTVIVSWESKRFPSLANEVRTQSLLYSPSGCVSASTHPFQAPCQPFFFGQALAPRPQITITGSVDEMDAFDSVVLQGASAEANVQIEQVGQIQTTSTSSGVQRTIAGTLTTGGGDVLGSTADTDPSTGTGEYATGSLMGAAGSLTVGSGANVLTVSNGGGGDTGTATSSANASATAACPLAATESDELPCGHATIQRQSELTATLTVADANDANLGTITLARFRTPTSATSAFSDRELGAGSDGRLEQTVTRVVGTVNLGGLPSGLTAPPNWGGSNAWQGYLVSLVNYQDSATAAAGTEASAPTTSRSGTLYYWNAATNAYVNVPIDTAGTITPSVSLSQTIDGKTVTVTITASLAPATTTTSSAPSGSGSITRTEVRAETGAGLDGTVTYSVTVDGNTVVSLSQAVNLGNLVARGTYQEAPSP